MAEYYCESIGVSLIQWDTLQIRDDMVSIIQERKYIVHSERNLGSPIAPVLLVVADKTVWTALVNLDTRSCSGSGCNNDLVKQEEIALLIDRRRVGGNGSMNKREGIHGQSKVVTKPMSEYTASNIRQKTK